MSKTDKTWDLSYTQNRELSWLKFNARVMDEAMDPHVPLLERLRFLSIFTSNLDEFFMVRVGSLTDLKLTFPKQTDSKSGLTPQQQLEGIYEAVRPLIRYRDAAFAEISAELKNKGVRGMEARGTGGQEPHLYPGLVPGPDLPAALPPDHRPQPPLPPSPEQGALCCRHALGTGPHPAGHRGST